MNGSYRTARKPHICDLCEEVIPAGESYWHEKWPPDRISFNWFTFRAHRKCNEVWAIVGRELHWELPNDPAWWREKLSEAAP